MGRTFGAITDQRHWRKVNDCSDQSSCNRYWQSNKTLLVDFNCAGRNDSRARGLNIKPGQPESAAHQVHE